MYKIGEFSKITNITVKALRYYDQQDILKPSNHLESGYRLYSQENYIQAKRIALLRALDFSVQEIKDVLATIETDHDLQFYLKEKQALIKKNIKKQRSLLNKIDTYVLPDVRIENINMSYEVKIIEIKETTVATICYLGAYQKMGNYMSKLYKYLKSNTTGHPFACYLDGDYKEMANIELCIPVKEGTIGNNEIQIKTLSKIKAITTTHIGKYEDIGNAYKIVLDYAKENQIEVLLPTREYYVKGPGMILKGNPHSYVTELCIPIKNII